MSLLLVGLSHKTAPIEIRERLAIPSEQLGAAMDRLFEEAGVVEGVLLSTCNRVEVYARPQDDIKKSLAAVKNFFSGLYKSADVDKALYHFETEEAVRHLFRVASGLDSMVVGETEILGQVKSAYAFSQGRGKTGKITNVLFQRAIFVGKQVRTKTNISEGASSVGSIAAQLAERIFGTLNRRRILLLGAGEIAEVTARHLMSQKAGEILILNRTLSKAESLAKTLNGAAAPIDRLSEELLKADIVIGSVSSETPIVTREMVQNIMKARKGRPLYFIDIAVPRNIEPSIHELDNVFVYNIDDLKSLVEENLGRRKTEMASAEKMVSDLSHEFFDWITATLSGKTRALKHGPS